MLRFNTANAYSPSITVSTRPTAPLAGDSTFGSIFKEVQAEVDSFIEHGAGTTHAFAVNALIGATNPSRNAVSPPLGSGPRLDQSQAAFVQRITPLAQEVGTQLGVAPEILVAQAALETGWGKSPLRNSNGNDIHNLFAIKSGANWHGENILAPTTEYQNGSASMQMESFRSYADDKSAMQDFAKLLLESPRYRSALNTGNDVQAYASALAKGGYATDPAYASKLSQIAMRIQSGD